MLSEAGPIAEAKVKCDFAASAGWVELSKTRHADDEKKRRISQPLNQSCGLLTQFNLTAKLFQTGAAAIL